MKLNTKDKLILSIIFILSVFAGCSLQAQSQIHTLAGYKSFEAGFTYQDEEFLNFGVSVSISQKDALEKRANRNDVNRNAHLFKSDVMPAVFGTVGATFDKLTITGKGGFAYIDQSINGIQEKQKLYLAVGIRFGYYVSDNVQFVASYDNVNSVMAGIQIGI